MKVTTWKLPKYCPVIFIVLFYCNILQVLADGDCVFPYFVEAQLMLDLLVFRSCVKDLIRKSSGFFYQ